MTLKDTAYREIPFKVEVPISLFEKSDAEAGKRRRIGGVISTESPDKQGDTILQRGLDFSDFLSNGWYNDNHAKNTTGVLGYPEEVQQFKKGEMLPDGAVASSVCTWAEGYLLSNWEPADKIWDLGKALQGTGRKLGFSVEGSIQRRTGEMRKTIAKAKVRNVAITGCPVNGETGLNILAKSLQVAESMTPEALDELVQAGDLNDRITNLETMLEKALSMGTAANPVAGPAGEGSKSGDGAGQVLAGEDLAQDDPAYQKKKKKDQKVLVEKSLTDSEAVSWVQSRIPGLTLQTAGRFVDITKTLKRRGCL